MKCIVSGGARFVKFTGNWRRTKLEGGIFRNSGGLCRRNRDLGLT